MADLSGVTSCTIREQAERAASARRKTVLLVGLSVAGLCLTVSGVLSAAALLVTFVLHLSVRPDARARVRASAAARALAELQGLPDDYYVLNQVCVPDDVDDSGACEIDVIVAGPDNVFFVIEVKSLAGNILGGDGVDHWKALRIARSGARSVRSFKHPGRALGWKTRCLLGTLSGQRPWVQGVVVFSDPGVNLQLSHTAVPCLRLEHLVPYLIRFGGQAVTTHGSLDQLFELKVNPLPVRTSALGRVDVLTRSLVSCALAGLLAVVSARGVRPLLAEFRLEGGPGSSEALPAALPEVSPPSVDNERQTPAPTPARPAAPSFTPSRAPLKGARPESGEARRAGRAAPRVQRAQKAASPEPRTRSSDDSAGNTPRPTAQQRQPREQPEEAAELQEWRPK